MKNSGPVVENETAKEQLVDIVTTMRDQEAKGREDTEYFRTIPHEHLIFRRTNGTIVNKDTCVEDLANPENVLADQIHATVRETQRW